MTPVIAVAPPGQAALRRPPRTTRARLPQPGPVMPKPGRDRAGIWLYVAAAGLLALAAAAAAVSFSAQYRLVYAARRLAVGGRTGGGDPRRRRAGVRLPGRGAGAARPPRDPGPAAEHGRGRERACS